LGVGLVGVGGVVVVVGELLGGVDGRLEQLISSTVARKSP
jgi:hypothetical protein